MRTLAILLIVAGCGADGAEYYETGECAPPADSTEVAATALAMPDSCVPETPGAVWVVGSDAEWNALFPCGQPIPAGVDFATQQAIVVHVECSPTDHRFTAERADEIVVGIYTWPSGACLRDVLVVPVPRSSKPVRLARCYQTCSGDCPVLP